MASQFADMMPSSILFLFCFVRLNYWPKCYVYIITGSGVMTSCFYKGLKLEIPPSEFCPISECWGKLAIPNLAGMSLKKSYYMLQKARVTAFIVSKLLRKKQLGGNPVDIGRKLNLHKTQEVQKTSRLSSEHLMYVHLRVVSTGKITPTPPTQIRSEFLNIHIFNW